MIVESELSPYQRGYHTREELAHLLPPRDRVERGRVAVIECTEDIPCNPCVSVCPVKAIQKESLCKPSTVDREKCVGCTRCVAACPGLAIFAEHIKDGKGQATMPYELIPEPRIGEAAALLDRAGKIIGEGTVISPTYQAKGDAYPRWIVTVEMDDPNMCSEVRAVRIRR